MNILGLSCFYHDSAASLIQDGKLIAAVTEERFNREKHYSGFPSQSVEYCLKRGEISLEDIDYVVFYEKPFVKFERILKTYISSFPKSKEVFVKQIPNWIKRKIYTKKIIRDELDYSGEIIFSKHHQSHAASAFFTSPFEEAAILTVDAAGEKTTTSKGIGKRNNIEINKEIEFPHSLGLLYSTFTAHLGFYVNSGEGKVMGMASYGKPEYYDKIMQDVIDVRSDGGFKLNMDYFAYHYSERMYSNKFIEEFGSTRDKERDDFDQRHANLAASIQKVTEKILLRMIEDLYEGTESENLCLAGGVALNCVANGKLEKKSSFENLYVPGAAGDDGASIGAAMYVYRSLLDNDKDNHMNNMYWGPEFSNSRIKETLDREEIEYREFKEDEIVQHAAEKIANGEIIGWFQGRMEFGPRALGNRSIIADPTKADIQDTVNEKIKLRETWRPFAPSVIEEKATDYLEGCKKSSFMIKAYPVNSDEIPSVTHIDNTARPQTVNKDQNERYYKLISKFEEETGIPVVLNTSFNRRGEPIVCTPEDALNCFQNSGLDLLIMNDILVEKKRN